MYNNEYFVVDMASCSTTGEVIQSLSLALETLEHSGKKIVLKLNNNYLNQSQMLSIQSLITSYGCTLDTIETINPDTVEVARNMNILVQKPVEKRVMDAKFDDKKEDGDFKAFEINIEAAKKDNAIALKNIDGLHFEADLDAIRKQEVDINIESVIQEAKNTAKEDFSNINNELNLKYDNLDGLNPEEFPESVAFDMPEGLEDASKNTIGVYKKAYDENEVGADTWEEVDFYETPINDPVISDTKETTYINYTLRSGQVLESNGNVVVIGDCHPGSEIRAVGDITVWGVLSGIAHAGFKGNINAKVRALKLNAVQLRIGDCYSRRPDGTNIPYIIKSSIFTPEEARVVDGEIMLFKINQN